MDHRKARGHNNQLRHTYPFDRWPRRSPWLVVALGTWLAVILGSHPSLFVGVGVIALVSGLLLHSDHG